MSPSASSGLASDSPSLLAQISAALTAIADAAAKANGSDSAQADDSSDGTAATAVSDIDGQSDATNAASTNSGAEQSGAARGAFDSLLAILDSNAASIRKIPGGVVLQQVVNFFRQMFGQPTPPASGTKNSPPSNPAKPGMSSTSPNGTNPLREAKRTADFEAAANNHTVSQASVRLPGSHNPSRSYQRRTVAQVRSENTLGQTEPLATHSAVIREGKFPKPAANGDVPPQTRAT